MKKVFFSVCYLFFLAVLISCVDFKFQESKQVFPMKDLSNVQKIEFYNYKTQKTKKIHSPERIKWYTAFFKDSSNYYKNESINTGGGIKALFRLAFVSEGDTLDLRFYPAKGQGKIIVAFLDPYDPENHWKYRRYNRFYINNRLEDSLENQFEIKY